MRLLRLIMLALVCTPGLAAAAEGASSSGSSGLSKHPWTGILSLGVAFGNKSAYAFNNVKTEYSDSGGYAIGVELDYNAFPYVDLGANLTLSRYGNAITPDAPDRELSVLFLPRFVQRTARTSYWIGFGIGFTRTAIGSATATSAVWRVASESPFSITWSPRAGVDYALNDLWIVGGQFAFVSTGGSVTNAATTTTASQTFEFQRSWFEIAARIGFVY